MHVIFNMGSAGGKARLPIIDGATWHRALDTALPAPGEIARPEQQERVTGSTYTVAPRSVVVLEAWKS